MPGYVRAAEAVIYGRQCIKRIVFICCEHVNGAGCIHMTCVVAESCRRSVTPRYLEAAFERQIIVMVYRAELMDGLRELFFCR